MGYVFVKHDTTELVIFPPEVVKLARMDIIIIIKNSQIFILAQTGLRTRNLPLCLCISCCYFCTNIQFLEYSSSDLKYYLNMSGIVMMTALDAILHYVYFGRHFSILTSKELSLFREFFVAYMLTV